MFTLVIIYRLINYDFSDRFLALFPMKYCIIQESRIHTLALLFQAANVLEADHHQKVVMKFSLRDKAADQPMVAHQTFVRLTYTKTGDEIIYVAEADAGSMYRFELVSEWG